MTTAINWAPEVIERAVRRYHEAVAEAADERKVADAFRDAWEGHEHRAGRLEDGAGRIKARMIADGVWPA